MWFAALAGGLAVAVVVLTPGGPERLWRSLHSVWMLAGGVGLQLVVAFVDFPADRIDDLGFGLLMASYALLLAFCFVNIRLRGMWLVALGIALNTVVVGLNEGMPTSPAERTAPDGQTVEQPIERTVKQRPESDDDLLGFLGDVVEIPDPIDNRISIGDIVLAIGLIYSCVRLTRRPGAEAPREEEEEAATSEFAAFWGVEPEPGETPAPAGVTAAGIADDEAVPVMAEGDTAIEAMVAVEGTPEDYPEPGHTKLAWDEEEIERKLAAGENRPADPALPQPPLPVARPPAPAPPPPATPAPRLLRATPPSPAPATPAPATPAPPAPSTPAATGPPPPATEGTDDPTPPPIHWTSEPAAVEPEPSPSEPEPAPSEAEPAPPQPAPPEPVASTDTDDDPLGAELEKLFARLSRGPDPGT